MKLKVQKFQFKGKKCSLCLYQSFPLVNIVYHNMAGYALFFTVFVICVNKNIA